MLAFKAITIKTRISYKCKCVSKIEFLLTVLQINAEFRRITAVPLTRKFMAQLDFYAPKMIKIFRKKGGNPGQKIKEILAGIPEVCHF